LGSFFSSPSPLALEEAATSALGVSLTSGFESAPVVGLVAAAAAFAVSLILAMWIFWVASQ